MNEQDYLRGQRSAWVHVLHECLRELAYDPQEPIALRDARLLAEREDVVARLRQLCEHHGDNDWQATDYLADVIDRHLGRYLDERKGL